MAIDKQTIRLANIIYENLQLLRHKHYATLLDRLAYVEKHLAEITSLRKKFELALRKNLILAADIQTYKIERAMFDIPYLIAYLQKLNNRKNTELPTLDMIIADIRQIEDEFDELQFDLRTAIICVTTCPITLQDVYLGPFEIQLEIDNIPDVHRRAPYKIVATDPHPAASNSDITHPHVSGGGLCEGDGQDAIIAALEQGRICDFFQIVRNILMTYNPDSPYVSLDEWYGVSCYECGEFCSSDEIRHCNFCDYDFCSYCSSWCRYCDATVCNGCRYVCQICDEIHCADCIKECKSCGESVCLGCLKGELCPECKKEQNIANETSKMPSGHEENKTKEKLCL